VVIVRRRGASGIARGIVGLASTRGAKPDGPPKYLLTAR
jgi:hypothetical protein